MCYLPFKAALAILIFKIPSLNFHGRAFLDLNLSDFTGPHEVFVNHCTSKKIIFNSKLFAQVMMLLEILEGILEGWLLASLVTAERLSDLQEKWLCSKFFANFFSRETCHDDIASWQKLFRAFCRHVKRNGAFLGVKCQCCFVKIV